MIYFYRENNYFDDILNDPVIKKSVRTTMKLTNFLLLRFDDDLKNEKLISYINLKYGDSIIDSTHIVPDRTPTMYKDYMPERKKTTYH